MDENIDKNLYVDADGKRIYTCCAGCIEKVNADPQKYIKELEDQGLTLEIATQEQVYFLSRNLI